MSLANPQQKTLINSIQGKSREERAQKIADYCNQQGITKEQLENIIKML